jgi:hypothetical protein
VVHKAAAPTAFAPQLVVIGQIVVQFDNAAEPFDLDQVRSEDAHQPLSSNEE